MDRRAVLAPVTVEIEQFSSARSILVTNILYLFTIFVIRHMPHTMDIYNPEDTL